MKFYRRDLRTIFRTITYEYYSNNKDLDKKYLSKREYFDEMWNLMNKEFNIDTSTELFQIECQKDEETNLKFLWRFILLNSNIDLKFNISHIEEKANISIFKKDLNKQKLRAIMGFMYENTRFYCS